MAPTPISVFSRSAHRVGRSPLAALFPVAALCALGAFAALAAGPAQAADASIVIDGVLEDMTGYAQALRATAPGDAFAEEDAAGDVRVYDPAVVAGRPIAEFYYANGFDQTFDVFAYDRSTRTLYLGLRVAGAVGDADGDGDPDANPAEANVGDTQGIGPGDRYTWIVRGTGGSSSGGRIAIEVADNAVTVHGATPLESAFSFRGSELEVIVRGIDLPAAFAATVAIGSGADGLGEDTHALGLGAEAAIAAPPAEAALLAGDETIVRANGGAAAPAASPADEAQAGAPAAVDASGAISTDAAVAGGLLAAAPEAVSDGIAVLGRAYPNPFAASVTFGYEVKGAGQSVDVGVFDVSGRMVARLASGQQGPGRASVRWDGKDDGGVRMAPGVYFLKASIGGVEKVQRLVRIDG